MVVVEGRSFRDSRGGGGGGGDRMWLCLML